VRQDGRLADEYVIAADPKAQVLGRNSDLQAVHLLRTRAVCPIPILFLQLDLLKRR